MTSKPQHPTHHGPDGRFRNPWPDSEPPGSARLLRWGRSAARCGSRRTPARLLPGGHPAIVISHARRGRVLRHLGRAFDGAAPDRRPQRAHRSGVQPAGVSGAVDGPAPGDGSRALARCAAAARRRAALPQPLRPPRQASGEAASRRAHPRRRPGSCRSASARTSGRGACARSSSWTGGRRRVVNGLRVTATPARHFSARRLGDRNRTLWCGFAFEVERERACISRATRRIIPSSATIGARCGPFDFVMIPIGAYDPRWFMHVVHVDPEEAVQIYQDLVAPHRRQRRGRSCSASTGGRSA